MTPTSKAPSTVLSAPRRDATEDLAVARTILEQLGGIQFVRMIGARKMCALGIERGGLSFQHMRGAQGYVACRVVLTAADLYRVAFYRISGDPIEREETHEDIYAEDLRGLFERVTGLRTSLSCVYVREPQAPRYVVRRVSRSGRVSAREYYDSRDPLDARGWALLLNSALLADGSSGYRYEVEEQAPAEAPQLREGPAAPWRPYYFAASTTERQADGTVPRAWHGIRFAPDAHVGIDRLRQMLVAEWPSVPAAAWDVFARPATVDEIGGPSSPFAYAVAPLARSAAALLLCAAAACAGAPRERAPCPADTSAAWQMVAEGLRQDGRQADARAVCGYIEGKAGARIEQEGGR